MLVLISIAAIGNPLFHPVAMVRVYQLSPAYKLGAYNSIFTTSGSISYAIGPLIAGILIMFFGLPSIALMAIPGIIGTVWIYWAEKKYASVRDLLITRMKKAESVQKKKFWWVPAGLVVILCSLRAWTYIGIITYLPALLILGGHGMDTITTSLIVTIMLCTGVGGHMTGGYLTDRYGRKKMLILGFAIAVPCFCLIFFTSGWLMYLGIFMYSFFASFCYVTSVTMVQELLPGSVGFASGLTQGLSLGIGRIGAAIIGWAADIFGSLPDAMFLLIIPTIFCPVLALFIQYLENRKKIDSSFRSE